MRINTVKYKNLYCKKDNLIIPVGGDIWFNWLLTNKSFHYQYESLHCHFSKDTKGYWTAIKLINGDRRTKRMGISYDLTKQNLLTIVYELNLPQDEYDLLRQNRKQHSPRDSRTWLKLQIDDQRQEIITLKKQIKVLESKLDQDLQNQEIIDLKAQVKQLQSRLKIESNSCIEYTSINGKMIPVYCD